MTFLTIEHQMLTNQRKSGIIMIEGDLIPPGRRMAKHAGTPQFTSMGVHVTVSAVLVAGLQHGFTGTHHMTGCTINFQVPPGQRKRSFFMIECDLIPALRRMAKYTGLPQFACMGILMAVRTTRQGLP